MRGSARNAANDALAALETSAPGVVAISGTGPPVALIRGRVVDAAGAPVALAAVYVSSAPVRMPDIAQLTGEDGTFVLAAPLPGTYVVGARSDAAGAGETTVRIGSDSEVQVEIVLQHA